MPRYLVPGWFRAWGARSPAGSSAIARSGTWDRCGGAKSSHARGSPCAGFGTRCRACPADPWHEAIAKTHSVEQPADRPFGLGATAADTCLRAVRSAVNRVSDHGVGYPAHTPRPLLGSSQGTDGRSPFGVNEMPQGNGAKWPTAVGPLLAIDRWSCLASGLVIEQTGPLPVDGTRVRPHSSRALRDQHAKGAVTGAMTP